MDPTKTDVSKLDKSRANSVSRVDQLFEEVRRSNLLNGDTSRRGWLNTIMTDTMVSHDGGTYRYYENNQNPFANENDSEVSAPFKNFKLVPVEHR